MSYPQNRTKQIKTYLYNTSVLYKMSSDDQFIKYCEKGNLDMIEFLVYNGQKVSINNELPLRTACRCGHLEVVKFLHSKGAKLRGCNNCAIRWAAGNGHLEIVQYLVDNGADMEALDNYPLKLAVQYGHLDVVKYLISKGCKVDSETIKYSFDSGDTELINYLLKSN